MFGLSHIVQICPAVVKGKAVFVVGYFARARAVYEPVHVRVTIPAVDTCYFVGVPATSRFLRSPSLSVDACPDIGVHKGIFSLR